MLTSQVEDLVTVALPVDPDSDEDEEVLMYSIQYSVCHIGQILARCIYVHDNKIPIIYLSVHTLLRECTILLPYVSLFFSPVIFRPSQVK